MTKQYKIDPVMPYELGNPAMNMDTIVANKLNEIIAEVNVGLPEKPFIGFSVPTGDLLGKKAEDFEEGLDFSQVYEQKGLVQGTLKKVTGFTAFNASAVEEQSGYYLPFSLIIPAEVKATGWSLCIVNGNHDAPTAGTLDDLDGLVWLGSTPEEVRTRLVRVDVKGEVNLSVTLDVSKLDFK